MLQAGMRQIKIRSRWLSMRVELFTKPLTEIWTALAILFALHAPAVRADMMDKSDMAAWEVCALCHSADGISAMAKFPKLAGQKATYLERQFLNFRSGVRSNDGGQMQAITTEVELTSLAEITGYFAGLPAPQARVFSPGELETNRMMSEQIKKGRELFYGGGKDLPACASCHADKNSKAPWVDGQHQEYLAKQLEDFRSGQRSDNDMQSIAEKLTEEDIAAVSIFLETEHVPRK